MSWFQKTIKISSPIARYRLRRILVISIAWTVIDLFLYFRNVSSGSDIDYPYQENFLSAYLLRSGIFLAVSILMSWLLLRELKIIFRNRALLTGWAIKVFILLMVAFAAMVLIFFLHFIIIKGISLDETGNRFRH